MTQKRRKRLFQALRLVLCLAALVWVLRQLSWHSRVTLHSGESCRLIELGEGSLLVEVNGVRREFGLDQITQRSETDPRPRIEFGLKDVVRDMDWATALLGLAVFAPCPVLLAVRLKWLLDAQAIRLTHWQAIKITYAGNFANFVLPGMTGGDLLKGYYVARHTDRKHEGYAVTLFDRVLGMACLVMLGGVMVLLGWRDPAISGVGRTVGLIVLAVLAGGGLYFSNRVRRLLRYDRWIERLPLGTHIKRLDQAAFLYRRRKRVILRCVLLTVGLQIVSVLSLFFAGWALDMVGNSPPAAIVPYLLYVPLGWLIAALPIAPQGLGFMEWAYIHFFVHSAHLADSESQAFFLAMLGRAIQMIWALPGLWILFAGMPSVTSEKGESASALSVGAVPSVRSPHPPL